MKMHSTAEEVEKGREGESKEASTPRSPHPHRELKNINKQKPKKDWTRNSRSIGTTWPRSAHPDNNAHSLGLRGEGEDLKHSVGQHLALGCA